MRLGHTFLTDGKCSGAMLYRFDGFELDTGIRVLRRGHDELAIEPRPFEVLRLLLEQRHRVVTKDEIVDTVWAGRFTSDGALTSQVKQLRRVLGDDGRAQRFVRTLHGRGYRFVAEVEEVGWLSAAAVVTSRSAPSDARSKIPPDAFAQRPTVAVLPFDLLAPVERLPGLAEALTHDLTAALSRARWLRVVARQSAFRFASHELEAAAEALGARYCLCGSVQPRGNDLRVTVELTDARDQSIVWSDTVTGRLDDVHAMRDDIARQAVTMTETQVGANEARLAGLRAPDDLDAWGAFHLGLSQVYRFSADHTQAAAALFERAISLDAKFARAHAALSFARFHQAFNEYPGIERARAAAEAMAHAEQALERDELDPFANFVRGRACWLDGSIEAGMPWLHRATAINPSFAQGHYANALAAVLADVPFDVQESGAQAATLSPLDPMLYGFYGVRAFDLVVKGELDASREWMNRAASLPGSPVVMDLAAAAVNQLAGDRGAAERWAARARLRRPDANQRLFFRALPFTGTEMRGRLAEALAAHGL